MNKKEREFYNYLVSLPNNVFDNWLDKASDEELELADKLFDEMKLGKQDVVEDVSEANSYLKKFTLQGQQ